MIKQSDAFLVLIILFLASVVNAQDPKSYGTSEKNQFFLLAGAPAIYSGISYERLVFDIGKIEILPRIGFGLNIFKPSLGKEFDFHLGLTAIYGNNHNLETGIGSIHYLLNQTDIVHETNYVDYKFGIYGLIGYRYYFKRNPFAFKIGFTPVFFANSDKWVFFPFAEIGIGCRL